MNSTNTRDTAARLLRALLLPPTESALEVYWLCADMVGGADKLPSEVRDLAISGQDYDDPAYTAAHRILAPALALVSLPPCADALRLNLRFPAKGRDNSVIIAAYGKEVWSAAWSYLEQYEEIGLTA